MSAPQFTPGPWSASVGNLIRVSAAGTIQLKSGGWSRPVCVAGVHRIGRLLGREMEGVAIANARLIAASPELYAALERLFAVTVSLKFERGDGPPVANDAAYDIAVNAARAALAKARGDQ